MIGSCYELSDLPECLRGQFGLRAYPKRVFEINLNACYDRTIYTCVVTADGTRMDFAKGSIPEVLQEYVKI